MSKHTLPQEPIVRQIKELVGQLDRNNLSRLQSWVIAQNTKSLVLPLLKILREKYSLEEIASAIGTTRQSLGEYINKENR